MADPNRIVAELGPTNTGKTAGEERGREAHEPRKETGGRAAGISRIDSLIRVDRLLVESDDARWGLRRFPKRKRRDG